MKKYSSLLLTAGITGILLSALPVQAQQKSAAADTTRPLPADSLTEVVVEGKKREMEIAADKKIFNIGSNMAAKGGTVIDALRQIPAVLVGADGKIYLRDGIPIILIDGKRTSLNLNQIPADQVQSIELITNPSAKYDAQGNRGFINIIMKVNNKVGLNGTIRSSWNTQNAWTAGIDANARRRKVNLSINYFVRERKDNSRTTIDRSSLPAQDLFHSEANNRGTEYFQRGKIGLDYYRNAANTFNIDADLGGGQELYRNQQQLLFRSATGGADGTGVRNNLLTEQFLFWHTNFTWTHRFKKVEEKLVLYAGLEAYQQPATGNYSLQYYKADGTPDGKTLLQQYTTGFTTRLSTFQADYTKPLRQKQGKLETGIKVTLHSGNNQNTLSDYQYGPESYVPNAKASYAFSYTDPAYAWYGNYNDQYGAFSYMAGIRAEQYDYTGRAPDGAKLVAYRNTGIFPGLFLSWKLNKAAKLQLNYSRRVRRPVFTEISPVTDYSNPQNLMQGNPALRPEFTHLWELAYNHAAGNTIFTGTLYWRQSQQFITSYTHALSADTLLTTYVNAKAGNTYGVELIVKNRPAPWMGITANLNGLHSAINGSNLAKPITNRGFSWFGKLSTELKLPAAITVQLTGNYLAPKVIPQGTVRSSGSLDLSAGRFFLKQHALSLDITMLDVFNTSREQSVITDPAFFTQTLLNKPQSRFLRIACSYRFKK